MGTVDETLYGDCTCDFCTRVGKRYIVHRRREVAKIVDIKSSVGATYQVARKRILLLRRATRLVAPTLSYFGEENIVRRFSRGMSPSLDTPGGARICIKEGNCSTMIIGLYRRVYVFREEDAHGLESD